MSGILLLITIFICLSVAVWTASTLGQLTPSVKWRGIAKTAIFLALLAAPFVDEVIGVYQFKALCKGNGIESADVSKAYGKTVVLRFGARSLVSSTVMPIEAEDWIYEDRGNGLEVLRHKDYYALGGWLMRYTPLSMGSTHAMFSGNGCSLVGWQKVMQENHMTVVN